MATRMFTNTPLGVRYVTQTGTTDVNGLLRISTVTFNTSMIIGVQLTTPAATNVAIPIPYKHTNNAIYWGLKVSQLDGTPLANTAIECTLAVIMVPPG